MVDTAEGIEVRLPLLHIELIEYCGAFPFRMKIAVRSRILLTKGCRITFAYYYRQIKKARLSASNWAFRVDNQLYLSVRNKFAEYHFVIDGILERSKYFNHPMNSEEAIRTKM